VFIEGNWGEKKLGLGETQVIYKQKNLCERRSVRVRVVVGGGGGGKIMMCDRYQQKKKLSRGRESVSS
jgi:hypothetical protein